MLLLGAQAQCLGEEIPQEVHWPKRRETAAACVGAQSGCPEAPSAPAQPWGPTAFPRLRAQCLARSGASRRWRCVCYHIPWMSPLAEVSTQIPALNRPPEPCSQGRYSLSPSAPAAPPSVSESESWKGWGWGHQAPEVGLGREGSRGDTRVWGKGSGWELGPRK